VNRELPISPILRASIAATLVGAALIHVAMVPQHMNEWAVEGVAFIAAGWLQVALAIAIMWRPRRWVVLAVALCSLALIGAWAVTRTIGSPWGPLSGIVEPASFVDQATIAIEAATVLFAGLAWVRPRLGEGLESESLMFASLVPVAAIVFASAAIVSPSASNHVHAPVKCPAGQVPPTTITGELAPTTTSTSTSTTVSPDGHNHATPTCVPADDNGFSALGNGHHHVINNTPLDPVTQTELDRQLAITREVALQYPTVAAAEAAGYKRAGPYSPGLGAHYTKAGAAELNASGVMTDDALRHPLSLQFDGNEPTSRITGFMYYSMSRIEPVGFVGTNDVWHYHTNICLKYGPDGVDAPFGADLQATDEQCRSVGGFMLTQTQWMIHVWSIPGYENPQGVFAEESPQLGCSDGTYYQLPAEDWATNPINICRSKSPGNPTV
jgi:hypothetical protein